MLCRCFCLLICTLCGCFRDFSVFLLSVISFLQIHSVFRSHIFSGNFLRICSIFRSHIFSGSVFRIHSVFRSRIFPGSVFRILCVFRSRIFSGSSCSLTVGLLCRTILLRVRYVRYRFFDSSSCGRRVIRQIIFRCPCRSVSGSGSRVCLGFQIVLYIDITVGRYAVDPPLIELSGLIVAGQRPGVDFDSGLMGFVDQTLGNGVCEGADPEFTPRFLFQ